MSNLVKHAKSELALLGGADDEMQQAMNAGILRLVQIFSKEGHSGFSAAYACSLIEKLLRFEPITPLTGADSEWVEVSDGLFQNNRCSHVFKGINGQAYDIEGKIWEEENGTCFTNFESRVFVDFPYVPKREYISVGKP